MANPLVSVLFFGLALGIIAALIAHVCRELHDAFGIEHATLQVERGDPAHPCPLAPAHRV